MQSSRRWVIASLAVIPLCAICEAKALEAPWIKGARLGMGYDTRSGELTDECVVVGNVSRTPAQSPGDGWTFRRIESEHQRKQISSTSYGVEAKMASFGASAGSTFISTLQVSDRALTMLVQNKLSVFEESAPVKDENIKKTAETLSQFRRRCGTHYISAISYGGELIMALERSEHESLSASQLEQRARVAMTLGAAAEASRMQSVQEMRNDKLLRISGVKAGGSGARAFSVDDFVEETRSFGSQVKDSPQVIGVTLLPYPTLKRDSRQTILIRNAAQTLSEYEKRLATLGDILDEPTMFDVSEGSLPSVSEAYNRLQAKSDDLRVRIEECLYPEQPDQISPDDCSALIQFKAPPHKNVGDGIPMRFAADCRSSEIRPSPAQFRGADEHPDTRGDGQTGPRMLLRLEIERELVDSGRRLVYKITKRVSEASANTGNQYERHFKTVRVDGWERSGCVVAGTSDPIPPVEVVISNQQTIRINNTVDTVRCWIGYMRNPPSWFRNQPFMSNPDSFDCDVTFLPIRNLATTNAELFDGTKLRAKAEFKRPSWID